jgi:hypothetical protein
MGEKPQGNWWQTSFFAPGSHAFFDPIFSRTRLLAQCNGVTQAAALVHDERIGVGRVYHLFRLPEDLEQQIFKALQDDNVIARIDAMLADAEQAMAYLCSVDGSRQSDGIGPVFIGQTGELSSTSSWEKVAALYAGAFERDQPIYPYFVDIFTGATTA